MIESEFKMDRLIVHNQFRNDPWEIFLQFFDDPGSLSGKSGRNCPRIYFDELLLVDCRIKINVKGKNTFLSGNFQHLVDQWSFTVTPGWKYNYIRTVYDIISQLVYFLYSVTKIIPSDGFSVHEWIFHVLDPMLEMPNQLWMRITTFYYAIGVTPMA